MTEIKLQKAFEEYGLTLSSEVAAKFIAFYELVVEWNKKMNLTAITEEDEFIRKHFLDSLSVTESLEKLNLLDKNILDLGTGAGFPGIPTKIYSSNLNITLMDALKKRVNFLNEVIRRLELQNINALHARAEDAAKTNLRESFDGVFSRAVASLPVLLEYALPFVKIGGYFISWKGSKAREEIELSKNSLNILGGKLCECKEIKIPELEESRALIIIKKERPSPSKYPRQAGVPQKKPL